MISFQSRECGTTGLGSNQIAKFVREFYIMAVCMDFYLFPFKNSGKIVLTFVYCF